MFRSRPGAHENKLTIDNCTFDFYNILLIFTKVQSSTL